MGAPHLHSTRFGYNNLQFGSHHEQCTPVMPVDCVGICTRLFLTLKLIAGNLYQALPNQNTESGDIFHLFFHGICHWLTSSDPSFILILK